MHESPTLASVSLVLNVEKLTALREAHAIKTDADLARLIGVDVATLFRVTSGRTTPSNAFMARLKVAFPDAALDDLFTILQPEQVAS